MKHAKDKPEVEETPTDTLSGRDAKGRFNKDVTTGVRFGEGQPGNLAGCPPQKHYLYHHTAAFMKLSAKDFAKLEKRKDLTMSQIGAIQFIKGIKTNKSENYKFLVERELGKARQDITETVETTINITITSYSDKDKD